MAHSKKLPPGIRQRGERLLVDLGECEALRNKGGMVELPSLRVALVRGKKRVRALCLTCPHKPKKRYRVGSKRPNAGKLLFRCGAHGWTWDRKGKPTGKAKRALRRLTVIQHGDRLTVHL